MGACRCGGDGCVHAACSGHVARVQQRVAPRKRAGCPPAAEHGAVQPWTEMIPSHVWTARYELQGDLLARLLVEREPHHPERSPAQLALKRIARMVRQQLLLQHASSRTLAW